MRIFLTLPAFLVAWSLSATEVKAGESHVDFQCLVLTEEFYSEGVDVADFNLDGHNDIVSGPFWYEGPEFRQRHRYTSGKRVSIKNYSKHFFSFTYDFNSDGRADILAVGMPGETAVWYENPGIPDKLWQQHHVMDDCGNESPTLTDLTGDGRPELICVHAGDFGFAEPNWDRPTAGWQFHRVSAHRGLGRFTHGLGVGDVDGDGKHDVLETAGWHQHVARPNGNGTFELRLQDFAETGGAQMFSYDFDGDGDNDVVSVQNAHAWGLTWFERRGDGDDFLWIPHKILTDQATDDPRKLAISQMHSLALADIDGDGVKDLITGKRFFAHGGGDPGAYQLPVLYWFRTIREPSGGVHFEPHLIHRRVGVGTQLTTNDIDGDGRVDIVVGNKLGTFVLFNKLAANKRTSGRVSLAGTADFSLGVREVDPKTPTQERETFVLPEGFHVQLFASEPEIAKPLNMAFDTSGRLWITNTLEYPYPVEVGKPGRDSIKVLADTDDDGQADSITTFADGLNIPMGLYPYRDGVVCFSIPHIWFLRDTDGDGTCDKREVLYGPFDHTRDAHGLCNAFTRGYDGWIYACHGFNNQSSVTGPDNNTVTLHSGNSFRFKLDGSRIEHFTHGQVNPFGMCYDARGDLLTADCHTKPVTLLLQGGYYESFGKPHDGLGFVPHVMDHLHGSTAIGGIAVTPDTWPTAFRNNALGGNVMTSRVNRNSLIYSGSSVRAQEESDFLISGDSWFRPVDFQFGPDGALYIADFYNRIIGHYEVPLEHPGRDRKRGRIWRVTYDHTARRRDVDTDATYVEEPNLSKLDLAALVEVFRSKKAARRMLAADRMIDEIGRDAIPTAVQGLKDKSAQVRLHCLWVLARLDALSAGQLAAAVHDRDSLVRTHAQRIIGAQATKTDDSASIQLLEHGLADEAPLVRRAAATATLDFQNLGLVNALLACLDSCDMSDVHLRHAIRIALKHQLQHDEVFAQTAERIHLQPHRISLIGDICLAIPSENSANFLVDHFVPLAQADAARITKYLQHAARYVPADAIPKIVRVIRSQHSGNLNMQLELLKSIGDGLQRRNLTPPAPLRDWAIDVATDLMAFEQSNAALTWQTEPHPDHSDANTDTWLASERRDADDEKETTLWSSFPNGEHRTGVYRSSKFQLGDHFDFYIAGHDGYPNQEPQQRNHVRLRDGFTHEVLKSWSPPRQDVAVRRSWATSELKGREVYVELVDGDASDAYAWIAVGRFSEAGLNPSQLLNHRQAGCELISKFSLKQLRPALNDLIRNPATDIQTRQLVARVLAKLAPSGIRSAVSESLSIASLPMSLVGQASQLIAFDDIANQAAAEYFENALKFATSMEQQHVAEHLVADKTGTDVLLTLVARAQLSPKCLTPPTVQAKVAAIASDVQKSAIQDLASTIPAEDQTVNRAIQQRTAYFLRSPGHHANGLKIFDQQCGVCHRVAGKGQQVGPNLDGIGNRGLARLAEDVLAPNRNVDIAFRATTVVTSDGQAITGLVRGIDGSTMTIVDTKAQTILVPVESIEEKSATAISPMPANFHQQLSNEQFADLMTYLLSLNK